MAKRSQHGVLARGTWGVFPHQLSWLLDNPVRRLFLSPRVLVDRLALSETSRVLELGPGPGYFSAALAKGVQRGKLVLLDLQPEMLKKARRKLESMDCRNACYVAADASAEFPYADGCFDVALLVSVLGEVPDKRACLRSIRRVLRSGGLLAIHESIPDPDRLKLEELLPFLRSEGFAFHPRWGPSWNYTATFESAAQAGRV